MTPDRLCHTKQPYKPSPVLDGPAFTSDSEIKDVCFVGVSAKHINGKWNYSAGAFKIHTGMAVVEERMGSAEVGMLKAVLLAVREKAKTLYVDSCAIWAGASGCVNGKYLFGR